MLDIRNIGRIRANPLGHIPVNPCLWIGGNVEFLERPVVDVQPISIGSIFSHVVFDFNGQPIENSIADVDGARGSIPRIEGRGQIVIPED